MRVSLSGYNLINKNCQPIREQKSCQPLSGPRFTGAQGAVAKQGPVIVSEIGTCLRQGVKASNEATQKAVDQVKKQIAKGATEVITTLNIFGK